MCCRHLLHLHTGTIRGAWCQIHRVPGYKLQDGRVTSEAVTSGGVVTKGVDVDVITFEYYPDLLSLLNEGVVLEGVDTSSGNRGYFCVDVKDLSKIDENSV